MPVSDAWRAAMAAGWRMDNRVQILANGAPVPGVGKITVTDLQVTVSRSAAQRRSCQVSILLDDVGMGLIPGADNSGPLTPFGNEIGAWSGWINPATGLGEYVPVGVFVIDTVTVADTGVSLTLVVTGYDRSYTMGLVEFLAAYSIAAGTRGDVALSALVTNRLGARIPQSIAPTGDTIPGVTFNEGSNPWTSAQSGIASPIGFDIFFDPTGVFTARPIPDPTKAPTAWSYVEGDGNLLAGASRSLTRNGVSNHFIVTGSGSAVGDPVSGEAAVTDQSSPMYVGGGFRDVPTFDNSSNVTTEAQAVAAAANDLAASMGQVETVSFTVAPNASLDVDDVVYAERARAGIKGWYVIDTATSTFTPAGQTVVTGRRAR